MPRSCATCGQFVDDDFRAEEGEIVRECAVCLERSKSTITIEIEGGEAVIRVKGDKVRIGR